MLLGEALRRAGVHDLIGRYGTQIDTSARKFGVDPGLIRGIIYEEQTHLLPVVESGFVERLGVGRTVGLGQVSVGLYGFSRTQLLNPATNIKAIATHLSVLQRQPLIVPGEPIPSLATRYNCGICTAITPYGRRVDFYRSELFSP
jgi:hypothetical protein